MVIPDENNYQRVRDVIRKADSTDKHITVFAMQPMPGGQFAQEILGFSLLSALGINPDEIRPDV